MTRLMQFMLMMIAGVLVLTGCSPAGPVRTFTVGETITSNDFSEPDTFEEGAYNAASLSITDGVYRIRLEQGDNELWWGQWGDSLADVVIDVDIQQTSERTENAFGVGCRMAGAVGQMVEVDPTLAAIASGEVATEEAVENATEEATVEATEAATAEVTEAAEVTEEAEATAEATEAATAEFEEGDLSEESDDSVPDNTPDGDGYLFLIQGNGQYAIMRARGRDVRPLVEWTASDKIIQGQEVNSLRAVCVGDYLALYINGEFVADATDTTYSEGQVGLMASAATRLGVSVEFDNLVVAEALSGGDES